MALTPYHKIVGATTRENELIGVGDIRSNLRSIHLNNLHTSSAATIDLYLYKPSTDTTAEETYYILYNYSLAAKTFLTIDDLGLLSFDNSTYALFISVGGSDTVDVFLNR
jgi:hypothetical protein